MIPGSVRARATMKSRVSAWKIAAGITRYHCQCFVEKMYTRIIAIFSRARFATNLLISDRTIPYFALFSTLGLSITSCKYFISGLSVGWNYSCVAFIGNYINILSLAHIKKYKQMEQSELQKARAEKQAYIVQHIDPNLYEDFHDFCTSYAGQIDIDKWPVVYVHELVAKFKDDLKKKGEEDQGHQRSFAVYQTTTGDGIVGSATLEMDQILDSLEDRKGPTQPVQPPVQPIQTVQQPKPAMSPSPNPTKAIPKSPAQQPSPTPFTKKSPTQTLTVTPSTTKQKSKSKQKSSQKKPSALDLLDSAFQDVGPAEKAKMDENTQKMNKSFFDSVNFWEVPKLDESNRNIKTEEKLEISNIASPKKDFKSVKLNLNVNEINPVANKGGSGKKVEEKGAEVFGTKGKVAEIETFNYNNDHVDNFYKIGTVSPGNQGSPADMKSEFDTFSMIADEEIKKKRSSTIAIPSTSQKQAETRKKSQTIKLKQVKDLRSPTSSKLSSFKQPYKGPRVFKVDFVDQVFCVKSSSRPNLAHAGLAVQIKNYQVIERSIFSSNYLMYNMKVLPAGTICKRNYEDFAKFKSTLQKFYPGIQLPYLEKEGWRETTDEYAKKQIQSLQFFMADILRNPELRNSRVTEEFLSLPDHKKMKRKFEQYDKMTKLKSIQELCLLEGKVEVALTQNQRVYNENMGKLVVKLQSNLQKYRKNCQSLTNYYSQAMATMLTIDDIFKQMQRDVQDFNKIVMIKEIQNLDQSFKKIRNHYKESYFRLKFQKSTTETDILPFTKYQKQNLHTSKQILELCNTMTNRYLKRMQSEASQSLDSSSYLSAHYNEYKQGIVEESKSIVVLKYQAGYLQAQASSELRRILVGLAGKIEGNWRVIGKKYLDQLAKSVNIWSQIA